MIGGEWLGSSDWVSICGWIWCVAGSEQEVVEEMELSCVARLILLAGGGASKEWPFLMSLPPPSLTLREGEELGGERMGVTWTHVRPGSAQRKPLGSERSLLLLSDWSEWEAGTELTDKPWLCSFFSWPFMRKHLHAKGVWVGEESESDQLSLRFCTEAARNGERNEEQNLWLSWAF